MIITKTPFRMSFFGGGTDLPSFFNENGGAVLTTTFDKYCYVTVRHLPPFFDYSNELVYSKIERVTDSEKFEHPAVRHAMGMLDMYDLRVTYEADLPARSGLGTSSSFAVGMLNAFHCLKGQYVSKRGLAEEAIHLERNLCAEAGGWQDQVAVSYGGLNRITFNNDSFEVTPVVINSDKKSMLEQNLMLFFTGFTRSSAEIHQSSKFADHTAELKELKDLVDSAEEVLVSKDMPLRRFGELLDIAWKLKKGTSEKISTNKIDDLYGRALASGAVGGKLLGAGGGGFLLFYVEPDAQESVSAALSDCLRVPFRFEDSGTAVVLYVPEDYEVKE